MHASINISNAEFQTRADKLLDHVRARRFSGVVLFDNHYILYYTGFAFIPTERPIAFVMNAAGERGLFAPRLEVEHARANALIDRVDRYLEYPYTPHPMEAFKKMLDEMGVRDSVGCDADGYPWILGYRGPTLTEMTGTPPTRVATRGRPQAMASSSELDIPSRREGRTKTSAAPK